MSQTRPRIDLVSISPSRLKGQRPGCPSSVRELMALNRRISLRLPPAARKAIFLGATGPRAARPGRNRRGADVSRAKASWRCQRLVKNPYFDAR